MKPFLFLLLLVSSNAFAQDSEKIGKLPFCGWRLGSQKAIRNLLQEQFDFLAPQKGDTIVDIGASSGSLEGCMAAGFDLSGVDFVLVDVDSLCLNRQKLENMRRYYSGVKGDSIRNGFAIVINTQDSLHLPLGRYQKVWLMNTLHEVKSPEKMARGIAAILHPGGELCVLEPLPKKEGQLHGGCNKPLLKDEQVQGSFLQAGFRLKETKRLPDKKKFITLLYRFTKE